MNNLTPQEVQKRLAAPFYPDEIEWRVQQAGFSASGNPYCMVIPYITNRAIQARLDEVFGVFGWENAYKPSPDGKGYLCGITVTIGDQRVTKWDGAEYTNIEALKGALSDSMKRAAVHFGIGRYLYKLDAEFAICCEVKNRRDAENLHVHYDNKKTRTGQRLISWSTPPLPSWAVPQNDYSEFYNAIDNAETLIDLREAFANAYRASEVNQDAELEREAIKRKDARKKSLLDNMAKWQAEQIKNVSDWLSNETKTFNELPTESTVKSFAEKISKELSLKTKEFDFDHSQLTAQLDNSIEARIKSIKSKK